MLHCWQILIFTSAYAIRFINRLFGSLVHKNLGPYFYARASLLVLPTVHFNCPGKTDPCELSSVFIQIQKWNRLPLAKVDLLFFLMAVLRLKSLIMNSVISNLFSSTKKCYKFSPLFSLLFLSRFCRLGRIIALAIPSWGFALQFPHKLICLPHLACLPALGQ